VVHLRTLAIGSPASGSPPICGRHSALCTSRTCGAAVDG